jgi:hypothetical protein
MNDSMWIWNNRPMTNEDIAETCEATASLLEGHWTKGSWYTETNGYQTYCVEGALAAALGLDPTTMSEADESSRSLLRDCPVYEAVCDTINEGEAPDWHVTDLPGWNDTDHRTEQEVLDILHATAKRVLGVPRDDA